MSWLEMSDRLPWLEMARQRAEANGQTAHRVVEPTLDLIAALVLDSERTAYQAMEKLNEMQRRTHDGME